MAKTIKMLFENCDATLELMYAEDGDEAFVTVQRKRDHEDEERVAILHPTEALEMAQGLIEFATFGMKQAIAEKKEPGDWD